MKKFTAAVLSLALCMGMLAACGDKKEGDGGVTPTTASQATEAPSGNGNAVSEGDIKYTISDKVLADEYPATLTEVEVTDEMCEDAIVCPGNQQRLASVMAKASAGEEVTIAYIGGSITDGSLASPQDKKCYAGLTQVWWENTFQDAKINYVNAGIGATDSYIGVHRAAEDVISKKPDLVVVEFSVNDGKANNQETYESLVRMLLNSETKPAVVSLVLCMETSYYKDHYLVANANQIPCVSYAKVAQANLGSGLWKWEDLGAPDKVHPNNGGHAVIAHLLTAFYNKVLESINDSGYSEYVMPESSLTKSRYENAKLLFSDQIEATASEGFEKTTISTNMFNNNGWMTTEGGSISFEVEAANFGMLYWGTTDGESGQFDVYVNDEYTATINADFTGQWGSYVSYEEVGKFGTSQKLNVKIVPKEDSTGKKLSIVALAIS